MVAETVDGVITRVQRSFGDEAGVQIGEDDIIRWINDAQKAISIENEGLMETTSQANVIINQADYSLPVDMNVLRSLKYKGYKLKPMTKAEFDVYLDGYSAPTGSPYGPGIPDVFMVWANTVTLFPKPNENVTNGLTIEYIRYPTQVSTSADAIGVPDHYFTAIIDYCLAQAYELDEDFEKKQIKMGEFQDKVMKLNDRNKWTAQEVYPSITVLAEDENFGTYGMWGGF